MFPLGLPLYGQDPPVTGTHLPKRHTRDELQLILHPIKAGPGAKEGPCSGIRQDAKDHFTRQEKNPPQHPDGRGESFPFRFLFFF